MAFKETFRRTVVFICAGQRRSPVGTGFFVDVDEVPYLVTARHVLDGHPGNDLYVRINKAGGASCEDIPVPRKTWTIHPRNDVAIRRFEISENHQGWTLPVDTFLTEDFIKLHRIGAGDEVFFVGLFIGHAGKNRNLPAMRFGRISLMPHENEQVGLEWNGPKGKVRFDVDAYLIDARAWHGFSGSPVFVTSLQGWGTQPTGASSYFRLLGLVHGEFEKAPMNSGLVTVIPNKAILDLLTPDAVVKKAETD